jgi:hypothetical protein
MIRKFLKDEETLAVQSSADLMLLKTGMPSLSTISCKTS